jgi:hypothetical protein
MGKSACNGGSFETITDFMTDLFSDGGDGILQFQDGTTALTSAQWSELDTALAKGPQPAASQCRIFRRWLRQRAGWGGPLPQPPGKPNARRASSCLRRAKNYVTLRK